ncbi:hypothetical protein [Nostoc sp.]
MNQPQNNLHVEVEFFQNTLYHLKNSIDAKLKMKYFIGVVGQFLSVCVSI